jgi:hypothetical protein
MVRFFERRVVELTLQNHQSLEASSLLDGRVEPVCDSGPRLQCAF